MRSVDKKFVVKVVAPILFTMLMGAFMTEGHQDMASFLFVLGIMISSVGVVNFAIADHKDVRKSNFLNKVPFSVYSIITKFKNWLDRDDS